MRTYQQITEELGHKTVHLLKMDIEGFEWPVLNNFFQLSLAASKSLPMQIIMEVHTKTTFSLLAPCPNFDFKSIDDLAQLHANLLQLGYFVAINEPNPYCPHCTELTLLRIAC